MALDRRHWREVLRQLPPLAPGGRQKKDAVHDLTHIDRLRPSQTQAVHLLLAFDLFAVDVAVDAHWLERPLYVRYLPGFEKMTEDERTAREFSLQNYLEKILRLP
jgi:hypothetical protein